MRFTLVLALGLVACSPTPPSPTSPTPTSPTPTSQATPAAGSGGPVAANDTVTGPASRWICGDGRSLTVTFYGEPDRAEVVFGEGGKLNLYQSMAASGVLYEDTTHSFHTKGDAALLTSGESTTTCRKENAQ